MNKTIRLLLWLFAAAVILRGIQIALAAAAIFYPGLTDALFLPYLISLNAPAWLLLLCVLIVLRYAFKISPKPVRYISVALGLGLIIVFEMRAHANRTAGFLANEPNVRIIPEEELIDLGTFHADSFGVTKFDIHSGSAILPRPLNTEGFRCKYEFTQQAVDSIHQGGEKALFFIGDSYTYGNCADSGRSFAELLDATKEYAVLNAGMGGTDLEQYRCVVKKYISQGILRPDEVVICICAANDFFCERTQVLPSVPEFFSTSMGGLLASTIDSVTYRTARESYAAVLKKIPIVRVLGNGILVQIIDRSFVLSTSANFIGEYFLEPLSLINKQKYISSIAQQRYNYEHRHVDREAIRIQEFVESIKAECAKVQVPVRFILIPGAEMIKNGEARALPGIITVDPKIFTMSDYPAWAGDHPNNEGHYKIFKAIKGILDIGSK